MVWIIFLTVIGIGVVYRFCFRIIVVNGSSMEPLLHDQDRVLIFRYWPAVWLRTRDVVVADLTKFSTTVYRKPIKSHYIIKRIVRLENQEIQISTTPNSTHSKIYVVPKHHVFLLSENPLAQGDSRTFGPAPYKSIVGKVIIHF